MAEQHEQTSINEADNVPIRFARVSDELKERAQWVNWQLREGRKVPINPRTLGNAGVGYENSWAGFPFTVEVAARESLGIGFVLTENDPYTCIDLDKVLIGNTLAPYAREILDAMQGYVELSPSGAGLHVWVKCREEINRRTKGIEIYSSHRWMTVTGRANPAAPRVIPERTEEVIGLIRRVFPVEAEPFTQPVQVEMDDQALWERLFSCKNGTFMQALYNGDLSVVNGDHSRGVIMLANMLAVFTDCDGGRMRNLMMQTGLVNAKWFEMRGNESWIEYQIRDAIRYVQKDKRL